MLSLLVRRVRCAPRVYAYASAPPGGSDKGDRGDTDDVTEAQIQQTREHFAAEARRLQQERSGSAGSPGIFRDRVDEDTSMMRQRAQRDDSGDDELAPLASSYFRHHPDADKVLAAVPTASQPAPPPTVEDELRALEAAPNPASAANDGYAASGTHWVKPAHSLPVHDHQQGLERADAPAPPLQPSQPSQPEPIEHLDTVYVAETGKVVQRARRHAAAPAADATVDPAPRLFVPDADALSGYDTSELKRAPADDEGDASAAGGGASGDGVDDDDDEPRASLFVPDSEVADDIADQGDSFLDDPDDMMERAAAAAATGLAAQGGHGARELGARGETSLQQLHRLQSHGDQPVLRVCHRGSVGALLHVQLPYGSEISASVDSVLGLSDTVEVSDALPGGVLASVMRWVSGGDGRVHRLRASGGHGQAVLAPPGLSDVAVVWLDGSTDLMMRTSAHLAHVSSLRVSTQLALRSPSVGFVHHRMRGTGAVAIAGFSSLQTLDLEPGEVYRVNRRYLMAWDDTVRVERLPTHALAARDSSVLQRLRDAATPFVALTGPGTVYLRARVPPNALMDRVKNVDAASRDDTEAGRSTTSLSGTAAATISSAAYAEEVKASQGRADVRVEPKLVK